MFRSNDVKIFGWENLVLIDFRINLSQQVSSKLTCDKSLILSLFSLKIKFCVQVYLFFFFCLQLISSACLNCMNKPLVIIYLIF